MNIMLVSVTEPHPRDWHSYSRGRGAREHPTAGSNRSDHVDLTGWIHRSDLRSRRLEAGQFRGSFRSAVVSISSILLALGVSSFIGVFFGFYPARRAAGLNPIEALRYE